MTVQIESTTDTPEAVTAAIGGLAKKETSVDKSEVEAKAKTEKVDDSDTSKVSKADDESESEESEDDELEADSKDADKPKKHKGFKKRIDKLNSRISEKERELEHWKAEALKAKAPDKSDDSSKNQPAPKSLEGRPDSDNFETHEDYVEALTDWKFEQRQTAKEAKDKETQFLTEHNSKINAHISRVQEFAKAHEDFHDLIEDVDDVVIPISVQEILVDSENGPELMYELAKDPEEFARICKLPPLAAARALGKFESTLSKSDEPQKESKSTTTKAPPPLKPVTSKSSNNSRKSVEDMSLAEYKQHRGFTP